MCVKICGITTPEDARMAERAGADAIGVVVFSDSPRQVSPDMAREIFHAVPAMTRVCVSHTTSPGDIHEICSISPDALQVSCHAPIPGGCKARIIRMIDPSDDLPTEADALIIDASHGTGRAFDVTFASEVMNKSTFPVFLAGGLTPENVADSILQLRPYGVDVASGVEYAPGKKDPEKVRRFIAEARRCGM